MFLGNFDYEKYGTMDYTHLRWYTYKSAIKMLERNGFEIINSFAEKILPWRTVLGHLPSSIQNLICFKFRPDIKRSFWISTNFYC